MYYATSLSVRRLVVKQRTADMLSKFFARLTLASKFFIVFDRSSSSFFTSAEEKKQTHHHKNVNLIQRVGGRLTKKKKPHQARNKKTWLLANESFKENINGDSRLLKELKS